MFHMGEQPKVASMRAAIGEPLTEPVHSRPRLLKTVRPSTEIADWVFRAAVLACALAVIVIANHVQNVGSLLWLNGLRRRDTHQHLVKL